MSACAHLQRDALIPIRMGPLPRSVAKHLCVSKDRRCSTFEPSSSSSVYSVMFFSLSVTHPLPSGTKRNKMTLLPSLALTTNLTHSHFRNPNSNFSSSQSPFSSFSHQRRKSLLRLRSSSANRNLTHSTPPPRTEALQLHHRLLHLAASTVLVLGLGLVSARSSSAVSYKFPDLSTSVRRHTVQENNDDFDTTTTSFNMENSPVGGISDMEENIEDEELKAALQRWKSKTFALTVPLRIVSLRGSIPPSWFKEFVQLQGRRFKLRSEFRGNLIDIFSDLSSSLSQKKVDLKSVMAADIVTIGDSWLKLGINKGIIESIPGVEEQDWFKGLSKKWKVYLRRNNDGELDPGGKIWAAPYRWGSMVIAYKTDSFRKHNMAPVEDWSDLWRPELTGKIAMVDSPREVVGAVLKYMGGSYNTTDIESQVAGGKEAAMQNLALLQKQVRLFDSVHYLKAFGVKDVWVAVGWSSDILPAAKRMSNVAVIVPKSGASLWADLWAIPAASKFTTDRIGGRVRGPSPLVHQWIEFCLQAARALPFKQEVIPGASPFALEDPLVSRSQELTKGKPKLDTNLVTGIPPPDILAKCEFLEPLPESTLKEYQWLVSGMLKPSHTRTKGNAT